MIEEEKIVTEEGETKPVEEEIELTEKDVRKVTKAIKKAQLDATKLTPETRKIFEEIMEKAKMPIHLEDKDIKLGEQELDVRDLNNKNWRQMTFRQQILTNIYLKQIVMGNTDILRMLMVIADKLGVKDIVKATDEVVEKINKEHLEKMN